MLFRCVCGNFEGKTVIQSRSVTDLRNDLRNKGAAFSHIESGSAFLYQEGFDVLGMDEDQVMIEELIIKEINKNGRNQEVIQVKCSAC